MRNVDWSWLKLEKRSREKEGRKEREREKIAEDPQGTQRSWVSGFHLLLIPDVSQRASMADLGGHLLIYLTAELEAKYKKNWGKFIWLEQRLFSSLLSTVDVVCATALGSGSSKVMSVSF